MPGAPPFVFFLIKEEKKRLCLNYFAAVWTSRSCSDGHNWARCTRHRGFRYELYIHHIRIYLTPFMQSLSGRVHWNRASERKVLLARCARCGWRISQAGKSRGNPFVNVHIWTLNGAHQNHWFFTKPQWCALTKTKRLQSGPGSTKFSKANPSH